MPRVQVPPRPPDHYAVLTNGVFTYEAARRLRRPWRHAKPLCSPRRVRSTLGVAAGLSRSPGAPPLFHHGRPAAFVWTCLLFRVRLPGGLEPCEGQTCPLARLARRAESPKRANREGPFLSSSGGAIEGREAGGSPVVVRNLKGFRRLNRVSSEDRHFAFCRHSACYPKTLLDARNTRLVSF